MIAVRSPSIPHRPVPTHTRFSSFPRTSPPPHFLNAVIDEFRAVESQIGTEHLHKGLKSDEVLGHLRPGLERLEFEVERGKGKHEKVDRPVFFGENGVPTLRYEIDAYHAGWKCGLEVEAGRAFGGGNAIYRDIVQACVMEGVDHLLIAVPNSYKSRSGGKAVQERAYDKTVEVARALTGHSRVQLPFSLVIIGY